MGSSQWKKDFPVFSQPENTDLCYFDTAATCLIPDVVAQKLYQFNTQAHANSHRGLYQLSSQATDQLVLSRIKIQKFINAEDVNEIAFCSGTTEAINIIAKSFIEKRLKPNSNIVLTEAEHHANFLPWQELALHHQVELRIIPISSNGVISIESLSEFIDENTALLAVNHISNVLGQQNPITGICQFAKAYHVPVLVDGAQAVSHHVIDVQQLGCDFYVFSGHKLYAGTGAGVMYIKQQHHLDCTPFLYGGGIVEKVTTQRSTYTKHLTQLESGTINLSAIVALTSAIDYLQSIDREKLQQHFKMLSQYLIAELTSLSFIQPLIKSANINQNFSTIFSFQVQGVHSHDVATILAEDNIAVRAGHHCAQPLHQCLSVKNSVRISLGIYNQKEDVDRLVQALKKCYAIFFSQ